MTTTITATTSHTAIEQMDCADGCVCLLRVGLTGPDVPWAATISLSSDYFGGGFIDNTWAHCLKHTHPQELVVRHEANGYVLADDAPMATWLADAQKLHRAIRDDEPCGTPADYRPIVGLAWDNRPISAPTLVS